MFAVLFSGAQQGKHAGWKCSFVRQPQPWHGTLLCLRLTKQRSYFGTISYMNIRTDRMSMLRYQQLNHLLSTTIKNSSLLQ